MTSSPPAHAAHLDGFDADRLDEVYGAGQTDQLALLGRTQRAYD